MAEPKDMWRCQMVNCGYVYDPDRATNATKYQLEPVLKTCLKTGNALYAGQQKRAFAL